MLRNRLFCFGYESPAEFRCNSANGTDDESGTAVWIASVSEEQALEWGRVIAERFVSWLFEHQGRAGYTWTDAFAHWVETDPDRLRAAGRLPVVSVGTLPNFSELSNDV